MSDTTSWRRTRPFWGGLLVLLAGAELLSIPFASQALPLVVQSGTVGASYLIALVLIAVGLLLWWQPGQRIFLGVVAVLVSLASFVYANLGGFVLGMMLGLVGGALAAAWTPEAGTDDPDDAQDLRSPTGLTFTRRRVLSGDELANTPPASPDEPRGGASGVWIGRVKDGPARDGEAGADPRDPGAGPDDKAGPGGKVLAIAVLPVILMSGAALHEAGAPSAPMVATEAASVSAPSLTMTGMKFHGVVELPTATGTVKMLWFTMDRAVLSGPRQTMGRATLTGSTFTFTGNVDIYTTKMTGTLLGLRQEFTAEHPNVLVRALKLVPRLDLPLTMTDIVSERPYVTADSLQAEGLRLVVAS
ncbi:DUF6114 domain-containing protein [Planotetraspora kaengkrachanensis]|uniref:Uncharacterized protein n=1 Tax=Planotetraspora kaengkrachanensis TaxID=575193 RepID=A0A8J3V807_9ACTN|nr:DUF6114 domain-containing protein [Planotetraspora kaengkrachanensis]GIG81673.1 hypothetical protein Pka01_48000 [Planotetraspora kaengkrachanensis]